MSATPNTDNLGPLIWVLCHNEAARDAALLQGEARRLIALKPTPARQALIYALHSGVTELRQEAIKTGREARNSGLLLYCWPGTKALERVAA